MSDSRMSSGDDKHSMAALRGALKNAILLGFETRAWSDDLGEAHAKAAFVGGPAMADLALTNNVSNPTPNVGETITFTIGLTNNGPNDDSSATVTDTLPTGLTYVSSTVSTGAYNPTTGNWTVGAIPSGSTYTLTLTATVTSPNPQTNTASITQSASAVDPIPGNNSASVTETPTACYVTGTLIRTMRSASVVDVAVEHLAIGDLVVTASGEHRPIKWIGHRGYAGRFANANPDALPICLKAGALADGVPARDLRVSPKHAMFLDGVLVPAECLVNGVTIVKATRTETVTYWHVELDSHDVLIAEGAPSESFVDDDSRGMFINARSFATLYPDAGRPEAIYCAPRVEHGYALETIRGRLAQRAGIAGVERSHGPVEGAFIVVDGTVRGWARNALYPTASVCLDILADGILVMQTLANRTQVEFDIGPHAFEAHLPEGRGRCIEVRRSLDGEAIYVENARAA